MNVQFRETDNITYTRQKMKGQYWMYNSEKLTTLRKQDGRWRQTKQKKNPPKNPHITQYAQKQISLIRN